MELGRAVLTSVSNTERTEPIAQAAEVCPTEAVESDRAELLYGDLNAFDPTASTKVLQVVRFPVGLHHSESDGYFE
jgi:hypothetical protein